MGTKVIVSSTNSNRISINNQQRTTIRSVAVAPKQLSNLSDLEDVVVTGQETNDVLVYDGTLNKYVIKKLPALDGGEF